MKKGKLGKLWPYVTFGSAKTDLLTSSLRKNEFWKRSNHVSKRFTTEARVFCAFQNVRLADAIHCAGNIATPVQTVTTNIRRKRLVFPSNVNSAF